MPCGKSAPKTPHDALRRYVRQAFVVLLFQGALLNCAGVSHPTTSAEGDLVTKAQSESPETRHLELGPLDPSAERILLRFEGVRHSLRSYSVRFFVNFPEADAATSVRGNARYGGSFTMYGHGMPGEKRVGEEAALEGYIAEIGKELEPFSTLVNVTDAVKSLDEVGRTLLISAVVLGEEGEPLPHATFKFDRAYLEAH